ncbi:hypothetical protein [Mycolicibacterium brumae]|nr:hypothetical protein MBRU_05190 [Mycolicibacterium brumae DSM 44177]
MPTITTARLTTKIGAGQRTTAVPTLNQNRPGRALRGSSAPGPPR